MEAMDDQEQIPYGYTSVYALKWVQYSRIRCAPTGTAYLCSTFGIANCISPTKKPAEAGFLL